MNPLNDLSCYEPTKTPIERNIKHPTAHFKSRTSPPQNIYVVSASMGRLNNHAISNGDVEFHPSEFPVESNSESVPDPYTTPIKSTDDYEMYHLLELFHSEHDDDIFWC